MINPVHPRALIAMSLLLSGAMVSGSTANAAEPQVARGKYLVSVISCTDCHTPGTFLGKPDMTRYLGGSEVGFEVPGLGVFYAPNLTPDKETGLGSWTKQQIATAITTGKRPDGRILAPTCQWRRSRSSRIPMRWQSPPISNPCRRLRTKFQDLLDRQKSRPHLSIRCFRRTNTYPLQLRQHPRRESD